jgi:chaperone required for assembly of F1-ATPase
MEIAAIMKRFYQDVTVAAEGAGWRVLLDGRGVKTAGGAAQVVPALGLAEALAAEWAGQGEEVDPRAFRLRDMADYAIDIVSADREAAIRAMLRFAETDTLCYRADAEDALADRQLAVWEPLLAAAEQRWDVHFERVSGVIHCPQPVVTLERMRVVLAAQADFTLAAINPLASLAASLVIALTAIAPGADATALWNAANLEEDWQAELWGKDAEAEVLRQRRLADFTAAAQFAVMVRER